MNFVTRKHSGLTLPVINRLMQWESVVCSIEPSSFKSGDSGEDVECEN